MSRLTYSKRTELCYKSRGPLLEYQDNRSRNVWRPVRGGEHTGHTSSHTSYFYVSNNSPLSMLNSQIPNIVKALHRQLKDKSVKTRQVSDCSHTQLHVHVRYVAFSFIQGCFGLLTDLVLILPGSLENEIGCLVPGIVYCLKYVL